MTTFDEEVQHLHGEAGSPTPGEMRRWGLRQEPQLDLPVQTLSDWLHGKATSVRRVDDQLRLIEYLEGRAKVATKGRYRPRGRGSWKELRRACLGEGKVDPDAISVPDRPVLGKVISHLTDADALTYEVHRAIAGAPSDKSLLPPYLPRKHDVLLRAELEAAEAGSRVIMVVGGSSTGKTRTCWEAIRAVLPSWRVWHPLTPERPDAVIDALATSKVAAHTVIWLNEAQMYLEPAGVGEQVASALQGLLHRDDGPLIVLGSLWPEHWVRLADPALKSHAAARALLGQCTKLSVPSEFSQVELAAAASRIESDSRLLFAAAQGRRITQHLAGAPEQVDRYTSAPTEHAKAVVRAAMDARRLSSWLYLPADFLREAAPGYLDREVWNQTAQGGEWFHDAVDYLTEGCHGAPGVLSIHNPLPGEPELEAGLRLADYVEQFGRRERAGDCPPGTFWNAAAKACPNPRILAELADEADQRARYHRADQLYRLAARHGNARVLRQLALYHATVGDYLAAEAFARQAADHGDTDALRRLALRRDSAGEPAAAEALAREAASLGDAGALRYLAVRRDSVGDHTAAGAYWREAADHGDSEALRRLALRGDDSGEHEAAEVLARQAADRGDTEALRRLALRRDDRGEHETAEALAREAADHGDAHALGRLALRRDDSGEHETAEVLARQAADHGDAHALGELALRRDDRGEQETAEALARQAADHGDTEALRRLALRRDDSGEHETADALAREAADHGDALALGELALRRDDSGRHLATEALAREAADHGDSEALRSLARRRDVAGDDVAGAAYWRDAADRGDAEALRLLALRHDRGGDRAAAEVLARQAADHGDTDALWVLALRRDKAGNHSAAEALAREAADHGDVLALLSLAQRRDDVGDPVAAEALAHDGAARGNTRLLRHLALRRDRAGDHETAEALARDAADFGDAHALAELAKNRDDTRNHAAAEALAREAAEHGDTGALRQLAQNREDAGDQAAADALWLETANRGDWVFRRWWRSEVFLREDPDRYLDLTPPTLAPPSPVEYWPLASQTRAELCNRKRASPGLEATLSSAGSWPESARWRCSAACSRGEVYRCRGAWLAVRAGGYSCEVQQAASVRIWREHVAGRVEPRSVAPCLLRHHGAEVAKRPGDEDSAGERHQELVGLIALAWGPQKS